MEIIEGLRYFTRDEILEMLNCCTTNQCVGCPNYNIDDNKCYSDIKKVAKNVIRNLMFEN